MNVVINGEKYHWRFDDITLNQILRLSGLVPGNILEEIYVEQVLPSNRYNNLRIIGRTEAVSLDESNIFRSCWRGKPTGNTDG
ncbi:MAG: hypothetical protein AMQ22_00055 [Candidatus Methanofastidiosum methylothiophilum]|uniref:Uncharacterized protein n=1 Tax=Candidatus Methanofastidiosum methylothiophilum TaxID=1705564 RepID=A0A150J9I7_9EURY|nr:MAG: hypothetical protein AMQ22_00055 [Candidatus Methanofastidiosum methylthiophilus]